MSPQSGFKTDPKRDATDSIRGYVYQAYQSVLAWMQLKENEILVLEGAEDFNVQKSMGIGLMADAAFALWTHGKSTL